MFNVVSLSMLYVCVYVAKPFFVSETLKFMHMNVAPHGCVIEAYHALSAPRYLCVQSRPDL